MEKGIEEVIRAMMEGQMTDPHGAPLGRQFSQRPSQDYTLGPKRGLPYNNPQAIMTLIEQLFKTDPTMDTLRRGKGVIPGLPDRAV